ncbi:hypothetical protein DPMN_030961, partial [Dreissena polymorpha]
YDRNTTPEPSNDKRERSPSRSSDEKLNGQCERVDVSPRALNANSSPKQNLLACDHCVFVPHFSNDRT